MAIIRSGVHIVSSNQEYLTTERATRREERTDKLIQRRGSFRFQYQYSRSPKQQQLGIDTKASQRVVFLEPARPRD